MSEGVLDGLRDIHIDGIATGYTEEEGSFGRVYICNGSELLATDDISEDSPQWREVEGVISINVSNDGAEEYFSREALERITEEWNSELFGQIYLGHHSPPRVQAMQSGRQCGRSAANRLYTYTFTSPAVPQPSFFGESEEEKEAKEKAEKLLLSHLSDEQKEQYRRQNYFVVKGGASGDEYRVYHNFGTGNVQRYSDGEFVANYCAVTENSPLADQVLAQKLMIETNEELFLRTANNVTFLGW